MTVVMVHSDLRRLLRSTVGRPDRKAALTGLTRDILSAYPGSEIWMPTFNYDFPRARSFDRRTDVSHTGVLTEYFRVSHAAWRTPTPIFSIAGTGEPVCQAASALVVEPLGDAGLLASLVRWNGRVALLGCGVGALSLFHHAELAGGAFPPYRYAKDFEGTTVDWDGNTRQVRLRYPVTDLRRRVAYDFDEIATAMMAAGAVRSSDRFAHSLEVDAQDFVLTWQQKAATDPLWPIAGESRAWVEPMLESLGRGFVIDDFEQVSLEGAAWAR